MTDRTPPDRSTPDRTPADRDPASRRPDDAAAGPVPAALLAAAARRRAPGRAAGPWAAPAVDGLSALDHVTAALDATVAALDPGDLDRPAPRPGPGWRVRDVLAHLVGVERYTGSLVGGAAFDVPSGTDFDHHAMTAPTVERLRSIEPGAVLAAWRAATAEAGLQLRRATTADPRREVTFTGLRLSLDALATLRAFERWTHDDDLRHALGLPLRRPDPAALHRMSDLAVDLIPLGMALQGVPPIDGTLRLVLTGPGGGTWRRALGRDDPSPGEARRGASGPDELLIVVDGAAFCRLAARRLDPARLDHHGQGDPALLDGVLRGAAAFAA